MPADIFNYVCAATIAAGGVFGFVKSGTVQQFCNFRCSIGKICDLLFLQVRNHHLQPVWHLEQS